MIRKLGPVDQEGLGDSHKYVDAWGMAWGVVAWKYTEGSPMRRHGHYKTIWLNHCFCQCWCSLFGLDVGLSCTLLTVKTESSTENGVCSLQPPQKKRFNINMKHTSIYISPAVSGSPCHWPRKAILSTTPSNGQSNAVSLGSGDWGPLAMVKNPPLPGGETHPSK